MELLIGTHHILYDQNFYRLPVQTIVELIGIYFITKKVLFQLFWGRWYAAINSEYPGTQKNTRTHHSYSIVLCLLASLLPFRPLHPPLCLVSMLNPEHIKLSTKNPDSDSNTLYHRSAETRVLYEHTSARCILEASWGELLLPSAVKTALRPVVLMDLC